VTAPNQGVGVGIPIGSLTVSGDTYNPAMNGVYMVTSGFLSFNTGFTGPNAILISGNVGTCVSGCTGGNLTVSGNLLTGTLASWTVDANGLHNATGPDTKNATLLAQLGIPANTPFGYFGFSLTTNGLGNQPGGDSVISTDIRNTAVPEPSSIILFGAVLFGCSALIRRRKTMVG
jgi:hypothetical protein